MADAVVDIRLDRFFRHRNRLGIVVALRDHRGKGWHGYDIPAFLGGLEMDGVGEVSVHGKNSLARRS